MRANSIGSLLALGLVWAVASASGCGGDSKKKNSGGGAGGATASGGASGSSGRAGSAGASSGSKMCGTETCAPRTVPIPGAPALPACCPSGMENTCGLDLTILGALGVPFPEPCQPVDQPGDPDPECPSTDSVQVPDAGFPVQFPGCCRPNGQCGYLADQILIADVFPVVFNLGCVDAAPFLDGGAPQSCGSGSGGEGGESSGGTAGAAGEPGAGGAAGETSAAGMGGA